MKPKKYWLFLLTSRLYINFKRLKGWDSSAHYWNKTDAVKLPLEAKAWAASSCFINFYVTWPWCSQPSPRRNQLLWRVSRWAWVRQDLQSSRNSVVRVEKFRRWGESVEDFTRAEGGGMSRRRDEGCLSDAVGRDTCSLPLLRAFWWLWVSGQMPREVLNENKDGE